MLAPVPASLPRAGPHRRRRSRPRLGSGRRAVPRERDGVRAMAVASSTSFVGRASTCLGLSACPCDQGTPLVDQRRVVRPTNWRIRTRRSRRGLVSYWWRASRCSFVSAVSRALVASRCCRRAPFAAFAVCSTLSRAVSTSCSDAITSSPAGRPSNSCSTVLSSAATCTAFASAAAVACWATACASSACCRSRSAFFRCVAAAARAGGDATRGSLATGCRQTGHG